MTMMILKWLSVADRFAKLHLDNQLASLGINSSQYMYLIRICGRPGISQDSLMECFYVHPSNIVRTVAALEAKGYLTREPCEEDRRTWRLYPTEAARAALGKIEAACARTVEVLSEELSPEEQTALEELLCRAGKRMARELNVVRREDEFDG